MTAYVYIYVNLMKPGKFTYEGVPFTFLFEPFYVGKGTGDRLYQHAKEARFRNKTDKHKIMLELMENGHDLKSCVFKYETRLEESVALELENFLIRCIGRSVVNRGPLLNLMAGDLNGRRHGHTTKISSDEIPFIVSMYRDGSTYCEIAEKLNVSGTTVRNALLRSNEPLRDTPPKPRLTEEKKELIVNLYKNGESTLEIGKLLNISHTSAAKAVKKHMNIESLKSLVELHSTKLLAFEEEIAHKFSCGISIESLAKEYGIYKKIISKFLQSRGFETLKRVDKATLDKVIEMYSLGIPNKEIRTALGLSESYVTKATAHLRRSSQ